MTSNAAKRFYNYSAMIVLTVFLLTAGKASGKNIPIPELPAPHIIPKAQSRWIAKRILQNGVPMSILQFSYSGTAQQVADYYQQYRANKPVNITSKDNAINIGYEENGFFYSIQVNNSTTNSNTQGSIVTSKRLTTPPPPSTDLPLISGSTIISQTNSIDGTISAETLMVSNHHSREANYRYFNQQLKQRGWEKTFETSISNTATSQELIYQLSKQSLQITLFPLQNTTDGRTGILIHWLK